MRIIQSQSEQNMHCLQDMKRDYDQISGEISNMRSQVAGQSASSDMIEQFKVRQALKITPPSPDSHFSTDLN